MIEADNLRPKTYVSFKFVLKHIMTEVDTKLMKPQNRRILNEIVETCIVLGLISSDSIKE